MVTAARGARIEAATMKPHPPNVLLCVLLFISLSVFIVIFLYRRPSVKNPYRSFADPQISGESDLKIRHGYSSYDSYVKRQLNKTLNPNLRTIWTTRDWERKVNVFSRFFADLKSKNLLSNESKALCVGARVGQEVEALRRVGVIDSIGIDLVPHPPLVVKGDFHWQPFRNGSFDFEFSNVFDHALYPERFVAEMERTVKPGGVCVLHVTLFRRGDKYSANDLFSIKPLVKLFRQSNMVHTRSVDGFGLDTEVVFRRNQLD